MVKLTLTPHRGNGARTFPSTGYLGLTPVTLAGVVRVKIEEDLKAVEASSLVIRVRCYESPGSGGGGGTLSTPTNERRASASAATGSSSSGSHPSNSSLTDLLKGGASYPSSSTSSNSGGAGHSDVKGRVLYEKTIQMWSPPDLPSSSSTLSPPNDGTPSSSPISSRSSSLDRLLHAYPPRSREASSSTATPVRYSTLGDFTKAWRIVIPPSAIEQGAKSTMVFKNWKIWWAVEAVISHRAQGIHGDKIIKSHQVALLSYSPLPSTSGSPLSWTSSPADPHPLSYDITSPVSGIGCSDPMSFDVKLSKKNAMAETPKKVVIELRREICFCSGQGESPAPRSKQTFDAYNLKSAPTNVDGTSKMSGGGLLSDIRAPPPTAPVPSPTSSSGHSKLKSEIREVLTIPPPLPSNPSAPFSFSKCMPSTPPSGASTPGENTHVCGESSYFGLFSKGSCAKQATHHRHTQHSYVPPAPIPITFPSSIRSRQNQQHLQDHRKRKDEITTLATFEVDCSFTSPSWHGTIQGEIPKSKSIYHYALGETCSTSFAHSRFYLVPKVQYKNKNSFIELPKLEIHLSTVSTEERRKALEQRGKIVAIQRAEARLFGYDDADSEKKRHEHTEKETETTTTGPSARASSAISSKQREAKQPSRSPRTRISQSASPRVGTGGTLTSCSLERAKDSTSETEEEDMPRLSTVRRRSEQADTLLETPSRTKQRFGPTSDLSPIVGSPYMDAVSPSLSANSASTSRPRTTGGRSRPTTANSARSAASFAGSWGLRPRSSAGPDHAAASIPQQDIVNSAWSTFSNASTANFTINPAAAAEISHISSHIANTASTGLTSDTPSAPPSLSSMTTPSTSTTSSISISPRSSSSSTKENLKPEQHLSSSIKIENQFGYSPITPSTVNGLFADFSGFSLRPPATPASQAKTSSVKEDSIQPKSTASYHPTSLTKRDPIRASDDTRPSIGITACSTTGKRKSEEALYHASDAKGSLYTSNLMSSVSSPVVALHEVTLASPPASISMDPNNASHNSLLSPLSRSNASSANMKQSCSNGSYTSARTPSMGSSSVYSKQQQQDVALGSPKRGKSGMSGALAFFRRGSTKT